MVYLFILFLFQAMKDNESDLHRLGEDVVAHITFIYKACKKLEGLEGQPGVQFHNVLDNFVKYVSFDVKSTFALMSLHSQNFRVHGSVRQRTCGKERLSSGHEWYRRWHQDPGIQE